MTSTFIALSVLLATYLPDLAIAAKVSKTQFPKLLRQVEEKYKNSGTFVAKFEQNKLIKALNRPKKSSGVIWFRLPNRFRWETYEPDPNILISNGVRFWHYSPPLTEEGRGQVIIRESAQIQSLFARALLAGEFSKTRGLTVKELENNEFLLTPQPGSAGGVLTAQIGIDPKKRLIQKVILNHRGGNRTEITLRDIHLGKKLPASMFEFEKPERTDVIRRINDSKR